MPDELYPAGLIYSKEEQRKQRYGDPFAVKHKLEQLAANGPESLSEDDLFFLKWLGLYTHRHERGYFMLRLKLPNGLLNPAQLRCIADIAEKHNKGFADITTREDIQLHWVHYKDAASILEQLRSVGITTDGACGDLARNVVGCPVAGVDKHEVFDASPLALQLTQLMLSKPEFANLPRKYKICVTGCRDLCPHPEIQCVSFVGIERQVDGKPQQGFDLRVGGGLSTQPFFAKRLNAFVAFDQVLPVATQITEIYRASPEYRRHRHRARLKFLMQDWGPEKFRAELERRLGYRLADSPVDYQDPPDQYRDHVGVYEQKQRGMYYIGAPVTVGRITVEQMRKVVDLAERHGNGTIRLSNRQNILLLNIPEPNVEKVLGGLSHVGLSINASPVRRGVVTCTGYEFCKLAITETKQFSRTLVEQLEQTVRLDEPLRIHVTGCPNACAQYQIGHIGLMGAKAKVGDQVVDAYDILVGGAVGRESSFGRPVVRKVPAAECAQKLRHLLEGYLALRHDGESFNAFCRRMSDEELARLITSGLAKKRSS